MTALWPEMAYHGDLFDHEPVEIEKKQGYKYNKDRMKLEAKSQDSARAGGISGGVGLLSGHHGYKELKAGGRAAAASQKARAAGVAEEAKIRPYRTTVRQGTEGPTASSGKKAKVAPGKSMVRYKPSGRSAPNPNPDFRTATHQAQSYYEHAKKAGQSARRLRGRGAAFGALGAAGIGGAVTLGRKAVKQQNEAKKMPRYVPTTPRIKKSFPSKMVTEQVLPQMERTINHRRKSKKGGVAESKLKPISPHRIAGSVGKSFPKKDKKAWRSIEQSERMAAKNRKNQRNAAKFTGGSLTALGATSVFGNVPGQISNIHRAGKEAKGALSGFKQVGRAAARNPVGALALGASGATVGGIGAWSGNKIAEHRNQGRADIRRKAYHARMRKG